LDTRGEMGGASGEQVSNGQGGLTQQGVEAAPRVILPEIELPAYAIQFDHVSTPDYGMTAMPAAGYRMPCPTCGCSSREHQDV
jgi:hypothetical protein